MGRDNVILAIVILSILLCPSLLLSTNISGDIWGVMNPENNPYNVVGDLRVPRDSTLSIQPRCLIYFTGHYKFIIDTNAVFIAEGSDVTFLTAYFKGLGPHPPDSCMCTETSSFLYHAGDANGNCVFSGPDVTYLVAYFKGQAPPPHFCSTCPVPNPLLLRTNIIPVISSRETDR